MWIRPLQPGVKWSKAWDVFSNTTRRGRGRALYALGCMRSGHNHEQTGDELEGGISSEGSLASIDGRRAAGAKGEVKSHRLTCAQGSGMPLP